jgi:hypothetical protein
LAAAEGGALSRQFYGAHQEDLNFFLLDKLSRQHIYRGAGLSAASGVQNGFFRPAARHTFGTPGMTAMSNLRNRLGRGAVCALVVLSAGLAASAGSASPRYDGLWSVLIVTEKGDCDRAYRYPIRVSNGLLANGGSDPFTISGEVAPTGAITVTVSNGSKSATGSGRLAGDTGGGLWQAGSCSGTWSAERRSS